MNIDIATTVKVILVLIGIAVVTSLVMAFKSIQAGRKLQFYQKRQILIYHGWRLVLLSVALVFGGFILTRFGEPFVYRYFPPSPTITLTPTITVTPTITLTPSQTFTPTITLTLAQTYTPALPEEIQATIQTPVGVDASAVFSPVTFSTKTENGVVIDMQTNFDLPIKTIYGGFSYDRMATGVQWTAIWLYEGKIICSETKPWSYAPGGYGYTDCTRPESEWKPGNYEVQIFVGQTWKNSGTFTVQGVTSNGTPSIPAITGSQPVPTLTPTLPAQ